MIGSSRRHSPRRAAWVALAAVLLALPGAANAQGLFSLFGGGPSSYDIERRLEESGYVVTGPLILRGDVYLADVVVRGEGPERLIIDPQSGRIMQRFRVHGGGWREAAAPPPDAWGDDARQWNGPRPPADVGPGAPPPDNWLAPSPPPPVVVETPKSTPKRAEAKPKPAPVANVANPPAAQPVSAATPKPAPPSLVKPAAEPAPAASTTPAPSPAPTQQSAKVDAPAVAAKPPASAPTPAASAKAKSVNDIPVTPLD